MSKRLLFGALGVVLATGLVISQSHAENDLVGSFTAAPNAGSANVGCPETLFLGDLGAEIGIGCSNGTGTSGGPNDIAQGVVAATPTPFTITSHFYNIFTQISPNITSLSFVGWTGGGVPGAEFGRAAGLPFAQGSHTVALSVPVGAADAPGGLFYIGHNQAQSNVGMRWGLDTSSGSNGVSFIRAPSCGASSFLSVDSLGFPGNWVFSVCVSGGATPVELTTWGAVKDAFAN